jgi:hypothetical protein
MDSISSIASFAKVLLMKRGLNAGFPDNIPQGTHNSGPNATRKANQSVKGDLQGGRAPPVDLKSLVSKFTNIRQYGYTSPSYEGDVGQSLDSFNQNYAGKMNWAIILGLVGTFLLAKA